MIPDELIEYLYVNLNRFKALAKHANKSAEEGKFLSKRELDKFVQANAHSYASIIVLEILESVETPKDMEFAISQLHSSLDRSVARSDLMQSAAVFNKAINILENREKR